MQRRTFALGVGALTSGVAAAVGTGAFSFVRADRDLTVEVTGDASAYLGLTGDDQYVSDDSADGPLTIDLGGPTTDGGGQGFNDEAITLVEAVVTITNQGTQTATVQLQQGEVPDGVRFGLAEYDDIRDGHDAIKALDPGESVDVDVEVDTTVEEVGDSGTLTVLADAGY